MEEEEESYSTCEVSKNSKVKIQKRKQSGQYNGGYKNQKPKPLCNFDF
jgi:hypothetical protein